VQPLRSSQHFMEPEGSLPSSQGLSTCTYPEPDKSSPQHSTNVVFTIQHSLPAEVGTKFVGRGGRSVDILHLRTKIRGVCFLRIASSGMLRRVALVKTDVSEELSTSFIWVRRIGVLGTKLAVINNRRTLRSSSETSVLTTATRRNIPEDAILHSRRRENLESYKVWILFFIGKLTKKAV
jgi:hypothetical protein